MEIEKRCLISMINYLIGKKKKEAKLQIVVLKDFKNTTNKIYLFMRMIL